MDGPALRRPSALARADLSFGLDIGEDLGFLPLMLRAPHESMTFLGDDAALMRGIHVMERETQRIIDPSNIKKRLASKGEAS